ncbi:hypothetical protein BU25DRAFT_408095 [Macroventuria anomochaeta]|uniref:Uncharacterized protein n=1 Tax=Macroventuria anomochaeta TaxID=301207 RepID=A0ACB6SBU7_9PLEO|nr:uncharacterized protein BU25DRAFT_408095 [Macroventuria anomochaeta]KAF2630818.1 hypothetical protein BU25DRAFT_408095 [Macroventuria anomochaeta]
MLVKHYQQCQFHVEHCSLLLRVATAGLLSGTAQCGEGSKSVIGVTSQLPRRPALQNAK